MFSVKTVICGPMIVQKLTMFLTMAHRIEIKNKFVICYNLLVIYKLITVFVKPFRIIKSVQTYN